jgi:hypothetical protein
MQSQQAPRLEAYESGALWLDRSTDRLQPHQQALPEIGDAGGIRRHQCQSRTSSERLSETHARMNAESLGSQRHLAHLLYATRLRCQRHRRLQQSSSISDCCLELKAREQNADDHGEHMFAR